MRVASVANRLTVLTAEGNPADVARVSNHRFSPDLQAVYERWDEFRDWATDAIPAGRETADAGIAPDPLGPPVPAPRQVFAIGLNYSDHAKEAGLTPPEAPPTFTKFPTCITGPYGELRLPSGSVDWEVELVVVVGRRAHHVKAEDAWEHIAGLTVGQDFSERAVQLAGPAPQFSLGKSFPWYGPIGPWLVTPDEYEDPDDLELSCTVNGEEVQKSRTSQLIFPVPELIARLSAVCPLLPGDLIFTGTPGGVGMARTPRRFLSPGDVVVSRIEGIGEIRQRCVA
jgi:2-keto-4-pentenoate hydratase/2-oxohepta-3-ene-1,7-dioic acid hydratase in catechol pathway